MNTTKQLIEEVRSKVDESNEVALDDRKDILPALNRAQDYACNVLARRYEEPLLTYVEVQLTGVEMEMPLDVFEQRVQKLEVLVQPGGASNIWRPLKRISYRDVTHYETTAQTTYPLYYVIYNSKLRILPPTTSSTIRIWYVRDPDQLVIPIGRVIGNGADFLLLDEIQDEEIGTDVPSLSAFVNVIEGRTGRIKGTLQVEDLDVESGRIDFRTSPTRPQVLGRPISALDDVDVELDDYLCNVAGSCIPILKKPLSNFIIHHAAIDSTLKLGGEHEVLVRLKSDFERQVERTQHAREQSLRVTRTRIRPARR